MGSVNVLNLVKGREAIVETFIIPEQVKKYTIWPYEECEGMEIATIKTYVRD